MERTKTPLEQQLDKLSGMICKVAYTLCIILFIVLNTNQFLSADFDSMTWTQILSEEIDIIMIVICICISSIPEGLSLSVVLALAYSVKAMMKDNNLVKKMKATETLGAVNIILSDKTGSLTKNQMTVVETDLSDEIALSYNLISNMSVNSTANLDGDKAIGNPTECAVLKWLKGSDVDYLVERNNTEIRSQKPFNSTDKYMLTVIADKNAKPKRGSYPDLYLVKGAPEVIHRMIGDNNDPSYNFLNKVEENMSKGRRCISFASGPSMDDLHYDGSVFIEDPVRDDVPDALKTCINAGIDVIMMTGDSKLIGAEIGRQANFSRELSDGSDKKVWAIEAKDFDTVAWGDPNCSYPNVIARCKPEDKLHILQRFQERGYICAGFGDGCNDASFLNRANVGVSVGSGTSVAKEASDIVLLDDSFPSIVKGVKWGRSLYKNIQSFLGFQLTVNVALCLTAICGPLLGIDSPFSILEILYINLVMDALGALALASEPAMDNVLTDKPRDINEFIINKTMTRFIGSTGIMMFLFMIFIILNISNGWWIELQELGSTGLFAIFMTANWMNLFRARAFGKNIGVFNSLGRNKLFIFVCLAILVMNLLIVQFGGSIFGTQSLDINQWGIVGLVSLMIIVFSSVVNRLWDGK